jgi:transcriptional regulator with XRE-family HTH domain
LLIAPTIEIHSQEIQDFRDCWRFVASVTRMLQRDSGAQTLHQGFSPSVTKPRNSGAVRSIRPHAKRDGARWVTPSPEVDRASFGAMVYQHRVRTNRSQLALAKAARLSAGYLSEIENGRRQPPPPHTVERLAAALQLQGVSAAELAVLAEAERMQASESRQLPHRLRVVLARLQRIGAHLPNEILDAIAAQIDEVPM